MPSRVTQGMLNLQLLQNLSNNLRRMDNYQNQLSSGRRINKPSDDPVGITFSLRYRSELAINEQYRSNTDTAKSWLDNYDTVLEELGSVIQRTRELTVKAANGTNDQTSLDSIKSEIEQLANQLVVIGNSQFNGNYIFNGQMVNQSPYSKQISTDPVTGEPVFEAQNDITDKGSIQLEIGTGVKMQVNITGDDVFGSSGDADNLFAIMNQLMVKLGQGDYAGISDMLATIDSRFNKILEVRSEIGAKSNRIDLADQRLQDIGTNLKTLQSKTEDADIPGVITNMKTAQNVYQASLAVGAQLIRPSLVDFLR